MESKRNERAAGLGRKAAGLLRVTGRMSGRRAARGLRRSLRALYAVCRERGAPVWYADNEYLLRREAAFALRELRGAGPLRRTRRLPAALTLCRVFLEQCEVTEGDAEAFLSGARAAGALPAREAELFAPFVFWALAEALVPAAGEETAARLFTALRALSELDLSRAMERSDPVDAVLRANADYPRMDEATRAQYRDRCRFLAKKRGSDPVRIARQALEQGLHPALFPFSEKQGGGYIAANVLVTVFLALLCGFGTGSALTALLLAVPLSELTRTVLDAALLRLVPARRLPRMELEQGVPDEARTVCAVSALLSDAEAGPRLAAKLEEYRLANRDCGKNLVFALLADLPESDVFPCPGAAERLDAAAGALEVLNRRYGGGFYLLTRDAVWSRADRVWMPWERKRGAILELARLIRGQRSALRVAAGPAEPLRARYILALDADTRLVPGSARALIGAAWHPLNRPVIQNGVVIRGHGALHPRMAPELPQALGTDFARLTAGQGGTDPYGAPTGELFSDLFGRGGFAGKGILDADAYLACLENRFPENLVLSHDALEGAYLRGAFLGDLQLTDATPLTAAGWFRRLHRWTRGDWQNLPWLFRRGRDLAPIDRYRLFDSLRRSLIAPFSLAVLVLGLCAPAYGAAGWIGLGCLAAEAAVEALLCLFARRSDLRQRCRSGVLRGLGGSLTRFMARLLLLPWEAWCRLSACLTSLWRLTVSKKRLLQWLPASQTDGRAAAPEFAWFAVALGGALLGFAPGALGRAAGVVWLSSPVLALILSRRKKPKNELDERDRALLRESAAAAWRYFAEQCAPEDNALPPDNVQEQPPKGAAHRTSPTNIGLALTACLCAADLSLCPREEAFARIGRLLSAAEALGKWRGHLYNWYDTRAKTPLSPAYVSTVDSGNLCACLLCVKHGLLENGQTELAARAQALADGMDFSALYDKTRRLFYIGLDPVTGEPSPGHYDLMASEARLTSFLAVARGDVPARHWSALSRAQLSADGWRGLASWSGSVFEYLMPELFLPLIPGSLLWETGRFCLYVQRRRGQRARAPWGNSESAYYSLDAGLDYRYKAHGAGALALCRDMNAELVVSPYSSFLALAVHPKAAVTNLRRLKALGLWGLYGFFEAIDYTPGRCPPPEKGRPRGSAVECYMSHHLGMSLAAAANCLTGGALRRRFMAETCCAAFRPLLAERVPLGGPVLRRGQAPEGRKTVARPEGPALSMESSSPEPAEGAWFPLSNGVYSLLACENGLCRAMAGDLLVYRPDSFFLSCGGTALTPRPAGGEGRSWRYEGGVLTFVSRRGDNIMSTSCCAAARVCGEQRRAAALPGGILRVGFEPVLARPADAAAHPAFWRMGLESRVRNGTLTVRRIARGSLPETWLALAATSPLRLVENAGWHLDGPVILEATLPSSGFLTLGLCVAPSRELAEAGARAVLTGGGADMASSMAMLLGLGAEGLRAAFALCGALAAPRVRSGAGADRQSLWARGVSGDLPVVYGEAISGADEAKRLIKRHALLTACGVASDLVIDTGEGGAYLHPRRVELRRFLEKYGLAPFENARGGVHFCDGSAIKPSAVLPPRERTGLPLRAGPLPARGDAAPAFRWLAGGAFSFDTPPLPPRAWSDVLTNGQFGFLATDAGTGHMWLENSRECPVNFWENDPLAAGGGETLEFVTPDGRHSLFADGDGGCRVTFGFGWARWERAGIAVTAFVPRRARARVLLVEGGEGGRLAWHTPLCLSAERADAIFAVTGFEDGCLTARNPRSARPDLVFRAAASRGFVSFTGDETAWLRGRLDGTVGGGLRPCLAAEWEGGGPTALVCGFESADALRALADPAAAAEALREVREGWRSVLSRVQVRTPDEDLDRLVNGWAVYQATACRMLGRTSLYQNGGAYGFRDQLQDAVNLLLISSGAARRQILRSCERQFTEGDVLHWWHETPEGPRGVRTRCSDDLIWLAWALCEFVEKTGDAGLCLQKTRWLRAEPLGEAEESRYFLPETTAGEDSVLEHARRALSLTLARGFGPHDLLRMGSGDWNDGMDRVRGESVWLTWFFAHTAQRFSLLLKRLGEADAPRWARAAERCVAAAEDAWDGRWYLRGYWADGAPLGAAGSAECALDSVSQSWAAFTPGADPGRVDAALNACYDELFDEAHGLTKLFWPPFLDGPRDPGYLRGCGPGFRENGGQYTHGALWLASALLRRGMTDKGASLLLSLLPARHPAARWETEPFVLAADVSANPDHYGAALWSWYTGSAGWFFRVVTEDLLGIRLDNGALTVSPRLPAGWSGFEADAAGRHIRVENGAATITNS